MRISYAIPVCNEHIELEKLLYFLHKHILYFEKSKAMFNQEVGVARVLSRRGMKFPNSKNEIQF